MTNNSFFLELRLSFQSFMNINGWKIYLDNSATLPHMFHVKCNLSEHGLTLSIDWA